MPLPTDFFDDDVNYRIRVCMTIEQDPIIGFYTGSKVHQCDRCGTPIWVHERQMIPEIDQPITGDVALCAACAKWCMEQVPPEDTTWIEGYEPRPGDDRF